MYDWLDELAAQHPDKVKVVVGGKSYEGRPIKGIEITFGSNLTGVLLEAGNILLGIFLIFKFFYW